MLMPHKKILKSFKKIATNRHFVNYMIFLTEKFLNY